MATVPGDDRVPLVCGERVGQIVVECRPVKSIAGIVADKALDSRPYPHGPEDGPQDHFHRRKLESLAKKLLHECVHDGRRKRLEFVVADVGKHPACERSPSNVADMLRWMGRRRVEPMIGHRSGRERASGGGGRGRW